MKPFTRAGLLVLVWIVMTGPLPGAPSGIAVTSDAFASGRRIPTRYTCDGPNVSPPLRWTGAPPTTRSFAIVCDDPDAPGRPWLHWIVYDLPAKATKLPEHVPVTERLTNGASQGRNDFRQIGYAGPCPPPDKPHHYRFKVYALDTRLALGPGAAKTQLEEAMAGHIIASGELVGLYGKR